MWLRSWLISASNMRGDSLSSMNSAAALVRAFCVFGSAVPIFSMLEEGSRVQLAQLCEAARGLFGIRTGVDSLFGLAVLGVVGFLFGGGGGLDLFQLGGILRLRDHIGRCSDR